MKKFAAAAVIPLFAGFLYAQTEQTTHSETTTKTTYSGSLIDAGCRTTHTEHQESSSSNPDATTSKSETTRTTSERTDCPATESTTTFGIQTSDGRFIRFDEPSNTRVVQVFKSNKEWKKAMTNGTPVRVNVVGTPSGDMLVVESIK